MTQLQKIVAKAKTLRKSYPNLKWTDLIKKASKLVTPAKKSVSGIKKAVATKYAPSKLLIKKRIETKSDFAMAGIKKKKAVKKSPARSLHKDTKSHNVNIRVVSGLSDKAIERIKNIQKTISDSELMKKNLQSLMKSDTYKKDKKFIAEAKRTIQYINRTNIEYKKMITRLKQFIK